MREDEGNMTEYWWTFTNSNGSVISKSTSPSIAAVWNPHFVPFKRQLIPPTTWHILSVSSLFMFPLSNTIQQAGACQLEGHWLEQEFVTRWISWPRHLPRWCPSEGKFLFPNVQQYATDLWGPGLSIRLMLNSALVLNSAGSQNVSNLKSRNPTHVFLHRLPRISSVVMN